MSSRHPPGPRRLRSSRPTNCVALIDDRFLSWLSQRDCEAGAEPSLQRRPLLRVLSRILSESGFEVAMRRVYWYTDRPDGQLVDDQIVRTVSADERNPDRAGEGPGPAERTESWRAISDDLRALARNQAFEMVLIASDDERLVDSIDQAQLAGVSVCLLADDSIGDFQSLSAEEPEWASLLAQADRRLAVRTTDLLELRGEGRSALEETLGDGVSSEQAQIEAVVRGWWSDQPVEVREDLRAALQMSPGIPQDVDRTLLLQTRERFVRPLSFNEKKLMRECLREVAASSSDSEEEEASLA